MRVGRRRFVTLSGASVVAAIAGRERLRAWAAADPSNAPRFELVQPELFAVTGGQPSCWADFDGDGDLDLFVGCKDGVANRLYRNDGGKFMEVAAPAGVADLTDTRAAAWADPDADGHVDLYVGFTRRSGVANKLYRNDGNGRFVDVAKDLGIDVKGETRQVSWIDFDNDGRLDLFVAFRDAKAAAGSRKSRRREGWPAATRRHRLHGVTTTMTAVRICTSRRMWISP
jgi:hypothetical protein